MTTENLKQIWEQIYFSEGDKTSGTIVSNQNGAEIAEYEIKNDTLEISIFKEYYQNEDFDNIIITESVNNILKEIDLNNETEVKFIFLN